MQQVHLAELLQHGIIAEFYTSQIQIDASLNPPPARNLQAPPVLHRLAYQRGGRHRNNRQVEILHLDRGQRDVYHIPVHALRGHRDPVAYPHHVVERNLHSGHQADNAVLEYQHQDRRSRTQTAYESQRLLVGKNRDRDNAPYEIDNDGDELNQAFHRHGLVDYRGLADIENSPNHTRQSPQEEIQGEQFENLGHKRDPGRQFRKHIGYAFGVEQAKQKIADEAKSLTLQQDFDPSLGMTVVSGFQNLLQNDADDPIDHEGRSP